jgi:hypothetical protein
MESIVIRDHNIAAQEPVFRGKCGPSRALTDYLEGAETLHPFSEQCPSITRELAIAAIEEARTVLVANLKKSLD